jgi:hypothetical protein
MTTVTKFPTTNAAHTTGLTNPSNAGADDGVYATAAPASRAEVSTDYGTFGFDSAIPAGATIKKVQIVYEHHVSTTASIASTRVNSVVSGTHDANHDDASEPTSDTVFTVDVTADRAWTRANLLDANFKVHFGFIRGNTATGFTGSLDYVKVVVDYTTPRVQMGIFG